MKAIQITNVIHVVNHSHLHTVHDGYKDYKCVSCGKSFSLVHNLKRHIQTVHECKKDFKCESCGKLFSQSPHLKKHIRTIHEGHKSLIK